MAGGGWGQYSKVLALMYPNAQDWNGLTLLVSRSRIAVLILRTMLPQSSCGIQHFWDDFRRWDVFIHDFLKSYVFTDIISLFRSMLFVNCVHFRAELMRTKKLISLCLQVSLIKLKIIYTNQCMPVYSKSYASSMSLNNLPAGLKLWSCKNGVIRTRKCWLHSHMHWLGSLCYWARYFSLSASRPHPEVYLLNGYGALLT